MRKAVKNYIVFAFLAVLGLLEAVSGFVLWFALPHGGGGWRGGRAVLNKPSGHYQGIHGLIFTIG